MYRRNEPLSAVGREDGQKDSYMSPISSIFSKKKTRKQTKPTCRKTRSDDFKQKQGKKKRKKKIEQEKMTKKKGKGW